MKIGQLISVVMLVVMGLSAKDSFAGGPACAAQRGIRHAAGPHALIKKIRTAIKPSDGVFFGKGTFDEETLTYVGQVIRRPDRHWHVALVDTIWGCAGRSTPRLLVFSSDFAYLGQYSHFFPRQPRVSGHAIVFTDADPSVGARIEFSDDGAPAHVVIDGDVLDFYK